MKIQENPASNYYKKVIPVCTTKFTIPMLIAERLSSAQNPQKTIITKVGRVGIAVKSRAVGDKSGKWGIVKVTKQYSRPIQRG